MPLVNFLIAGTQKGGTNALWAFLSQHPDVCMAPCKEVHYFDYADRVEQDSPDRSFYHGHFPNYAGQRAVGEATPIYMYLPECAARIREYDPLMKLILVLRHPADRAWSQYWMERNRGWEWLPFRLAVGLERARLLFSRSVERERSSMRTHSYLDRGRYARQIRNLLRFYPRDQILILKSEDLLEDHESTVRKTLRFLGVADDVIPPHAKVFEGGYPRMDESLRKCLVRHFIKDIYDLEELTGMDFSLWRRKACK